jgi:LEA14-like dessication related protein
MYIKIIILIFILSFLASCKFTSPEFRRLETWKVNSVSPSEVSLSNQVVFYNPNKFGGIRLQDLNLEVYANEKKIGIVKNPENIKTQISGMSEFLVPITVTLKTLDILGGIESIIGIALGNSINIHVKGNLEAGLFFFKKQISIDYKQPVSIKDIKK